MQKLQKFVAELAVTPFGHDLDVKKDSCRDRQKYPDDYQSIHIVPPLYFAISISDASRIGKGSDQFRKINKYFDENPEKTTILTL